MLAVRVTCDDLIRANIATGGECLRTTSRSDREIPRMMQLVNEIPRRLPTAGYKATLNQIRVLSSPWWVPTKPILPRLAVALLR